MLEIMVVIVNTHQTIQIHGLFDPSWVITSFSIKENIGHDLAFREHGIACNNNSYRGYRIRTAQCSIATSVPGSVQCRPTCIFLPNIMKVCGSIEVYEISRLRDK